MPEPLDVFEAVVRRAFRFDSPQSLPIDESHPFELRNLHSCLDPEARELFDNGHYAQATFEAFKLLDKLVQRHASASESGFKLMTRAFAEASPLISLTRRQTTSEKDEQKGYQFLFAGAVLAIRNPRGHEPGLKDDPDTCLDHLSLVSMLVRRLEDAGYK